jgi:hypothetical protein
MVWEAIAISLAVSLAAQGTAALLTPSQKIDKGGLNDLSVPKSSYGATIPECWGQVELAGNLLWATAIKEVTKTEQQGGSGSGAQVTERSYFGNFAVLFAYTPHRPAEEFLRIKLNGKVVYDLTDPSPLAQQTSTDFASKYVRFYYGTATQNSDPLIASTTPIQSYDYGLPHNPQQREAALTSLGLPPNLNHIPAYRYKVYAVFENLPLADYNNAIPAVKAEILFNSNNTAETIITDICDRVGISDFDTTAITNIEVPGFYLDRQIPATEAIRFLQQAYFFDIIKSGKTLKFIPQSFIRPITTIPETDLAAVELGQNRTQTFSLPKPDTSDLPESVEVNFLDKENSYDNGNVISRSQVAGSKKKESYSFPIVMTSSKAQAIADTLLHKFYLESITLELDLPPKYAYLEVGDWIEIAIDLEPYTLQITKIQMGANRLLKLNTKLVDAANLSNLTTTTTISTGGYNPPVTTPPKIPGNTHLQLMDINLIKDEDADNGIYASAYGTGNWLGCSIYASTNDTSYYFTGKTIDSPGTIGTLASNFDSSSTSLLVSLDSGSFESIAPSDLAAGINKLLVGNEIIQFQNSAPNGNNHQLTGLIRGLRGTESFKNTHTLGERVVLLTGSSANIVRLPGKTSDLQQLRYFKAPANGQSLNSATSSSLTIQGLSLEPYSPVNLAATKDNAGNITLTWNRRDRHAGDATTYDNLPLSEISEKWEIEVLGGNAVIRLLESSKPTLVYSSSQQITDFGSNQSSITVKIYQISATVGRGYAFTANLTPSLLQPPPVVTKIQPSTITLGDTIHIYGTGLNPITEVKIGTVAGTNFVNHSDTHLSCKFDLPAVSGLLDLYVGTTVFNTDEYLTILNIDLSGYMKKIDYLLSSTQLINPAKISYPVPAPYTLPYTLLTTDLGLELAFTNATGILTIPAAGTNFVTGWGCVVSLTGTGSITIQRSGG